MCDDRCNIGINTLPYANFHTKENVQLNSKSFCVNFFAIDLRRRWREKSVCVKHETWKHKYTIYIRQTCVLNPKNQNQNNKNNQKQTHTRIIHTWWHPSKTENRKSQQKRIESNRIWKRNSFDDSEVMPLFRVWIYRICSGNSFTHRNIFVGMKPRNKFKQKLCEHLLIHLDKSGNKNKQKPGQTTPKTIRFSRWHILLYLDYKLEINNSVRERKLNET